MLNPSGQGGGGLLEVAAAAEGTDAELTAAGTEVWSAERGWAEATAGCEGASRTLALPLPLPPPAAGVI